MSFLNKTGLSYLWTKIKNYLTGAHVSTSVISGATDVDGALTKLQTKAGTATLTTTAKNLSGAVNELDSGLDAQSQQIECIRDGLAIVANGNTHAAIKIDQFVYVKNHSTLAEGLYRATVAIPANNALSASNLMADTSGGLNTLNSKIEKKTIPLTASSGVTLSNKNCFEMNGVVCLSFKATGNLSNAENIASIPSEYVPSIVIPALGVSNSDDSFRIVYIGESGNIAFYGASATDLRITIVYIR